VHAPRGLRRVWAWIWAWIWAQRGGGVFGGVFGGGLGGVVGGEGVADKEEREGRCTLTKKIQERILRRPS
jgi:hypothetical protein